MLAAPPAFRRVHAPTCILHVHTFYMLSRTKLTPLHSALFVENWVTPPVPPVPPVPTTTSTIRQRRQAGQGGQRGHKYTIAVVPSMANDAVYNRVRKMSFRSTNKKHLRSQHCMKSETSLCDRRSTIAYPPNSVKTSPSSQDGCLRLLLQTKQ